MTINPSVYVHPTAICESDSIGPRTRVWAFAHVMSGAVVGADCNICDHVFIEGGARIGDSVTVKNNALIWDKVTIEDQVFVGPNVVFTNDLNPRVAFRKGSEEFLPTLVGRGASIGANTTILCGIRVGPHSMLGAGSVVIRDVPSHAVMAGNPARLIGWMCVCGGRIASDLGCTACGRSYERSEEGGLRLRMAL
jgi:UDP-2-acetamido-3-amino-2,3-dideoxy-glucuronate N-acetyltransferase